MDEPRSAAPDDPTEAPPYTSALAEAYEAVMAHVDYRRWAGHAHDLLQDHAAPGVFPLGPRRVLELGCGTGALARWLQPRGPYRYLATDGSAAMLRIARQKARAQSLPIRFREARFTAVPEAVGAEGPFDAVVLLYDGLNYLLEERQVSRLLGGVAQVLRPGGLFVFDQSTPANSAGDPDAFAYEGAFETPAGTPGTYRRTSQYDAARRLHETTFTLWAGGQCRTERHVQRAYDRATLRRLLRASPLATVAAYDGLTTAPATDASRRVHWVAQVR